MTQFGFPPRSSRGAVLGFSWGQLGACGVGVLFAVVALNLAVAGHRWSAVAALTAAVVLVTVGLLRLRGRRVLEWLPILVGVLIQRAAGQDRYRGAVFAANPEQLDLPGPAAGYRWLTAVAGDGTTEIGLLHHRRERTVTAALACSGTNLVLADTTTQSQRLVDWARALNILGSEYTESGLVRWAVTTRAVPDAGNRAQRYLATRAVDTDRAAYRSLAELTAATAPTAQRHEVYLTVVFDAARLSGPIAAAGGTDAAIAAVVAEHLPGIAACVAEAGVTVQGWLTPRRYAAVLRTAYDPADQEVVDLRTVPADGTGGQVAAGVAPAMAGPVAAETVGWSAYRHDSGWTRTMWVAQMPRQLVGGMWLTPLFTQPRCRCAVTLLAQPVPAAQADLASRRERVAIAGDEVTKRKLRLVRTARDIEEARSVEQLDREQAAGHVRYRYALLIAVTADTVEVLERDTRTVKRILSRAGCEAVTLYGEQDQGFAAAALPLARGLQPLRGWSG